jgi:hypothetical protein
MTASSFSWGSFDPASVPQGDRDYQPIPAGEYRALIKSAEERPTRDGTGLGLNLQLQILGPSHQNRVLFCWINLRNKNEKAQEIGLRELAALCAAIGVAKPSGAHSMVGKIATVAIEIKPGRDGEPENRVKRWMPKAAAPVPAGDPVVRQSAYTPPSSAAAIAEGGENEPPF